MKSMMFLQNRQRRRHQRRRSGSAAQRGVTLLFALLTLAALSLAAVALVRSVDTSGLVIGNLGFKQDSTAYAGQATEEAIAWLDANKIGATLNSPNSSRGYYPTALENLDPTNSRPADAARAVVDWDGNGCATPYAAGSFATCLESVPMGVASATGTTARFLITRLCLTAAGPTDPGNSCARPPVSGSTESGEKGDMKYGNREGDPASQAGPYFRIVARSVGARNSISYTETIVHF